MQVSAQPTPAQSTAAKSKTAKAPQSAPGAPQTSQAQAAAKMEKMAAAAQKKMPSAKPMEAPASPMNNGPAAKVPRSYAMVISSFEHVARNDEIPSEAADQLGETISGRLGELNKNALREIQDLPEFKRLGIDDINDLGDEISDLLQDGEESVKAFALLKNSNFANLMESKESVHRSFAEMMQENGDEKLLFGALQTMKMVEDAGQSKSVSIRA